MGRRRRIDLLTGQHVHPHCALAEPFEVRQVRMQIERLDPLKQPKIVARSISVNQGRRAVRLGRWAKTEPVFDRYAQSGEERASEPAEPLARRNATVAVMEAFGAAAS